MPVEGVRLNLGAMILGSNYIIKDVNSIIKLLFVILGTIFITFDFPAGLGYCPLLREISEWNVQL